MSKMKKYNIMIKFWNNILIIISILEYNLVLGYKNFRNKVTIIKIK